MIGRTVVDGEGAILHERTFVVHIDLVPVRHERGTHPGPLQGHDEGSQLLADAQDPLAGLDWQRPREHARGVDVDHAPPSSHVPVLSCGVRYRGVRP